MFYKLQDAHPRTYQYAFMDLSFAGYTKSICAGCGRENTAAGFSGPHRLAAEGGPRYPDYLPFSGAGGPMLILSERAVTVFRENGITGIGAVTPVAVVKFDHGTEVPLPESAPDYYQVTISGTVDLDLPQMCLKKKRVCPDCGGFSWNRQRMPKMFLDESTWDGGDLCRVASIPGYVICSETVVTLVKKHQLKGFAFEPV